MTFTPVDKVSIGFINVPLQRFRRYTCEPDAPETKVIYMKENSNYKT